MRAAGLRVVTQRTAPLAWGAWLRGVGLDAVLVGDRLIAPDGRERDARSAIEQARAGDTTALLALLQGS